jgi:hypothetical protein
MTSVWSDESTPGIRSAPLAEAVMNTSLGKPAERGADVPDGVGRLGHGSLRLGAFILWCPRSCRTVELVD